eukprot:1179672-Prorocentrum_minimum.AAC.1
MLAERRILRVRPLGRLLSGIIYLFYTTDFGVKKSTVLASGAARPTSSELRNSPGAGPCDPTPPPPETQVSSYIYNLRPCRCLKAPSVHRDTPGALPNSLQRCYGVDVKGFGTDVKGYAVDVKGYFTLHPRTHHTAPSTHPRRRRLSAPTTPNVGPIRRGERG